MKPTSKRFIFYFAFACFVSLFVYSNFIKRTKGFSIKKILSKHDYNPRWDIGEPTEFQDKLLDQVTAQTFRYLGSGKECYAFLSDDGEFVIKFFKQKHMKTQLFMNYLPLPPQFKLMRSEILSRRTWMRQKHFTSYQIAYERLPKETGVLFLHLNPTQNLNRSIHLLTPQGKSYTLDMDKTEFLIQKRADRVFIRIMNLMEANQVNKAKAAITSILDLLIHRSVQGIGDDDNNCERNLGFIDDRAVHIDVGEFHPIAPTYPEDREFYEATADLRVWLQSHYPDLATYLDMQIEQRIHHDVQRQN